MLNLPTTRPDHICCHSINIIIIIIIIIINIIIIIL